MQAHPGLSEHERKKLCRMMDCQRLSLEACMHAAQNERLPLRIVVQVRIQIAALLYQCTVFDMCVRDDVDRTVGCVRFCSVNN
jgi:hypothetical protein